MNVSDLFNRVSRSWIWLNWVL